MAKFDHLQLLGIDYGSKVIGLATYKHLTDPFPLMRERIIVENRQQSLREILKIVEDEFIEAIVLGLPFLTDGGESSMTKEVKNFGAELVRMSPSTPLFYQDETLSSFAAQERMKSDPRFNFKVDPKKIDALSAVIIIESFINDRNI